MNINIVSITFFSSYHSPIQEKTNFRGIGYEFHRECITFKTCQFQDGNSLAHDHGLREYWRYSGNGSNTLISMGLAPLITRPYTQVITGDIESYKCDIATQSLDVFLRTDNST